MLNKTDNEALNRLADVANSNSHLLNSEVIRELQSIYSELYNEYILFEQEVELNEFLMEENEELKVKIELLEKEELVRIR